MADSRAIAQLAGPTIVAVTLSELLHLPIWATNLPTVTYLNGGLLFLAGVAILRVHNLWVRRWPLLVTLLGWACALGGLYRMFAPLAPQAPMEWPSYVGIALFSAMGCFLTYKGYGPGHRGDIPVASGRARTCPRP